MIDPNEMEELREAYYDLYDAVEEFVVPTSVVGLLDTEEAIQSMGSCINKLRGEGYTQPEINFLAALAVCDIRDDMVIGQEIREAYRDHDES
jgi:hypothetical protein